MKVKGQILICTAVMLNDHSNPYIESTTVLSDTLEYKVQNLSASILWCIESPDLFCTSTVWHRSVYPETLQEKYSPET